MAERTDPTQKQNHPFYCQYRAVYEYAMQFIKAKRVLEIGCGEGYGAHLMAQTAKEVFAIDKDKKTIQKATRRYRLPNLRFEVKDVSSEKIKEVPRGFDVICCFHVIEHLKAPGHFLAECGKLLAAHSGVLLISTPNRHSPFRLATGFEWPYHEQEYTEREFRDLLLTRFQNVALYPLEASPKVHQFHSVRAQHLRKIFRMDLLKLRKWLPKRLLRLTFDIGGTLLKRFMSTTHPDLIYGITPADFQVSEQKTSGALDWIGICRTPRKEGF